MQYGYLIGCLIIALAWSAFYATRKDLRKEMIFGSLLAVPFALTEIMFIPEYWNPPSLFGADAKYGIGLEDFLFCFFVGGIAAVIFELIERKKTVKIRKDRKKHYFPYFFTICAIIVFELTFPEKTIYNLIIALLAGAAIMGAKRKDLIGQIFLGALFFSALYFLLFLGFNKIFSNYIAEIYTLENFWGINVANIPLEEIIFAFSVGAFWSILYEFARGYKIIRLPKNTVRK